MAVTERPFGGVVAPLAEPGPLRHAVHEVLRFVAHKQLGALGAVLVVVFVAIAIAAPVIAPYGPLENSSVRLQGPSAEHLAGTDQFGRDILSRVIHGARISLYIGVGATLIAQTIAVTIGIPSAHFGGRADYAIQRFVDTIQALPGLLLLMTIMVILGPGLVNVIVALSFSRAITASRVIRGTTLRIVNETYVEAARSAGGTDFHIMRRHLLPNVFPTVIVIASLEFGAFILAEASLSFLGFGVPPPNPSWGGMLAADGRAYMFAAPWMLWAPTVALALVVFGVNMFGDALRDVLDPRLRGSR